MADQVVVSIVKIIQFIYKWQGDYKDSQNALKTIIPTIELVKNAVTTLNIKEHKNLETPLRSLMDCLSETKDILVAHAKKKGKIMQFFFPKNVTEQIEITENRIHKLVSILNLAVSSTHLNQSFNNMNINNNTTPAPAKPTALDFITNEETKKFWQKAFGDTVFSVKCDELEKALMATYLDFLDSESLCDLRLRLDNLNSGFVSCHRLSDFCGNESLSRRLQDYTEKKKVSEKKPVQQSATSTPVAPQSPGGTEERVTLPLLIWVDDNAVNNQEEIQYAQSRGVCVVLLGSTSEAKQWIIRHQEILEEEDPKKVKMITDNAREGAETVLDINAGEDMIRFVRGRRSTIPIMVYCGNLDYTKYTSNYKECCAANKRSVCKQFIDDLSVDPTTKPR